MTYDQAADHIKRGAFAHRSNPSHLIHYATAYAEAGRTMTGRALAVQCLYVLNNLSSWRGDHAKDVRKALREMAKEHVSFR